MLTINPLVCKTPTVQTLLGIPTPSLGITVLRKDSFSHSNSSYTIEHSGSQTWHQLTYLCFQYHRLTLEAVPGSRNIVGRINEQEQKKRDSGTLHILLLLLYFQLREKSTVAWLSQTSYFWAVATQGNFGQWPWKWVLFKTLVEYIRGKQPPLTDDYNPRLVCFCFSIEFRNRIHVQGEQTNSQNMTHD